ncbi:MAG TPA: glycosidase [Chloroflexota bacterium]|jgi:predicted GH43/DUF377 family glycosyl hydrolase|nr:glycosidase [Chloroflexota bacterium]
MLKPTHDDQQVAAGRSRPMRPYAMRRLSIVMRPQEGNALEAGGVLNPGGARGPDGAYYLFPRLVAAGNYSRVGIARVVNDRDGVPSAVERLGVVLEPEAPYERNRISGGGCEDARVVHVPALNAYVMTYAAFGPHGPHGAIALSRDLFTWNRRGLIDLAPLGDVDMNLYGNKDVMVFPEPVPGPDGTPSLALLHRPMYELWQDTNSELVRSALPPPGTKESRWTMWLSFCPMEQALAWAMPGTRAAASPLRFTDHHLLITPEYPWEIMRIGGGTPPIRRPEGWLTIYHGISPLTGRAGGNGRCYSAGALLLDPADPRQVLYRSPEPVLAPELEEERAGVVSDVVFPTAIDQHDTHIDVYYGMADACIGVARMDLNPA